MDLAIGAVELMR